MTLKLGDLIKFSESGHLFIVKKLVPKKDGTQEIVLSRGNHNIVLVHEPSKETLYERN